VFQVRAGHTGLNQPTSPPRLCAFSHTTFGDAGLLSALRPPFDLPWLRGPVVLGLRPA
jgi:hypothetical protein